MEIRVPKPLVREMRAMTRDYPEVNYIEKKEESRDTQLARILFEALEELNLVPPVFDDLWTFEALPVKAVRPLLDLARLRLLNELCQWMVRNDFRWQAGDVQVNLYDRWRSYLQLSAQLAPQAQAMAANMKTAENMGRAWGENLTEMYDAWRGLQNADWLVVNV
jgi:hypothetical protein